MRANSQEEEDAQHQAREDGWNKKHTKKKITSTRLSHEPNKCKISLRKIP